MWEGRPSIWRSAGYIISEQLYRDRSLLLPARIFIYLGTTEFNGKVLTSPNDCIISRNDGAVWFTDPDYGSLVSYIGHGNPNEQIRNHVFRLDRDTGAKWASGPGTECWPSRATWRAAWVRARHCTVPVVTCTLRLHTCKQRGVLLKGILILIRLADNQSFLS